MARKKEGGRKIVMDQLESAENSTGCSKHQAMIKYELDNYTTQLTDKIFEFNYRQSNFDNTGLDYTHNEQATFTRYSF